MVASAGDATWLHDVTAVVLQIATHKVQGGCREKGRRAGSRIGKICAVNISRADGAVDPKLACNQACQGSTAGRTKAARALRVVIAVGVHSVNDFNIVFVIIQGGIYVGR